MTEQNESGLTAAEEAYFASGGETDITSEAAPSPEPSPELPTAQEPTPEPSPQDRDDKGRFVPHQALHAEREEHKKTKAALEEISRRQAVLDDRWNTMLAANKQQEEQPSGPPDPNEDLFGYIKWQGDQLNAIKAEAQEKQKAEQQANEQRTQEQQLNDFWVSSIQSYSEQNKDFTQAADWLSEYRHKMLAALAPIDPKMANSGARNAQIDAELKAIITAAAQQQRNPAELVFELAKGWGFQPKAPEPAGNELTQKLAQIDAAQNASRTLAASPGRNAGDPMSPEAIANMSATEFEAWMKIPENARHFQKIMGG